MSVLIQFSSFISMIVYRIIFVELFINRIIEVLYCVQVHVCGFIKS